MVDQYLNQVLRKQLKGYYVPSPVINSICQDIALKMNSLLAYREDVISWKGVLLAGQEEGQFYRPSSDASPFIVTTIRNSLIETYHAAIPSKTNRPYLLDDAIRSITESAISFWDGRDLTSIISSTGKPDYYQEQNTRYPAAWRAMQALGSLDESTDQYSKITTSPNEDILAILEQNSVERVKSGSVQIETQDGNSTNMNPALTSMLNAIHHGELDMFYSNCFKMVSRNYGKLLSVIEYVLHFDKAFITANYYITNGYVEKRTKLLPPAHNPTAVREMSNLVAGSRGEHRKALQNVIKSISQ